LLAKPTCHRLRLPSPSATPNLLPCSLNRTLVTLANVPGGRGTETAWTWPHSHICTEPSWEPVRSETKQPVSWLKICHFLWRILVFSLHHTNSYIIQVKEKHYAAFLKLSNLRLLYKLWSTVLFEHKLYITGHEQTGSLLFQCFASCAKTETETSLRNIVLKHNNCICALFMGDGIKHWPPSIIQ
jgi:hypothetical protein